jgi:hypothetical protein
MRFFLALLFVSGMSMADDREIQRALIQRDQQSAEFARRGLENLHSDQLRDAGLQVNPELFPYERQQMARDREMFPPLSEPPKRSVSDTDLAKPLPLPGSGGPPQVVEPISTPSIGG